MNLCNRNQIIGGLMLVPLTVPLKVILLVFVGTVLFASRSFACPDDQYEQCGPFGLGCVCLPEVGGTPGQVFEHGKKSVSDFVEDAKTWVQTGKCGGDICDAFKAAINFEKAQVVDTWASLQRAEKRFSEGKPLDAIWHIGTDDLNNSNKNAAEAAQSSPVLAATGQVVASVYGGPGGAAAYTAWLTYNTTHKAGDAFKAGLIAGISALALGEVKNVKLDDLAGTIAARAIVAGAISGAAVAAAGGNDKDIKGAIGMGAAMVLVQEGYRELTKFDLDDKRLKSSTGEAYCLADVPPATYAANSPAGCFAPASAYARDANGNVLDANGNPASVSKLPPKIDFSKLDPDRPHVGTWAHDVEPVYNIAAENSPVMTGISRIPGWNAMAVFHDTLSNDLQFDMIPGGIVLTVGTIPPSVILTYVGSQAYAQQLIREAYLRNHPEEGNDMVGPHKNTGAIVAAPVPSNDTPQKDPIEVTHVFCGIKGGEPGNLLQRTDIIVETAIGRQLEHTDHRLCEVRQHAADQWYELGHAHYQKNYCHDVASRIVRTRQARGFTCFAAIGIKYPGGAPIVEPK